MTFVIFCINFQCMERWIKTDKEIFHWFILTCKQRTNTIFSIFKVSLSTRVSKLATKKLGWIPFPDNCNYDKLLSLSLPRWSHGRSNAALTTEKTSLFMCRIHLISGKVVPLHTLPLSSSF